MLRLRCFGRCSVESDPFRAFWIIFNSLMHHGSNSFRSTPAFVKLFSFSAVDSYKLRIYLDQLFPSPPTVDYSCSALFSRAYYSFKRLLSQFLVRLNPSKAAPLTSYVAYTVATKEGWRMDLLRRRWTRKGDAECETDKFAIRVLFPVSRYILDCDNSIKSIWFDIMQAASAL